MERAAKLSFSALLRRTKERSVNFSKDETNRLQSLVQKYKKILMCKKTVGTSSKQKDHAWHCIEKEFIAIGQTPRTVKQLKYKFENMKRCAKEATREQEIIKTGGGNPPAHPPSSEDATDWLRSIMSTTIDGNVAEFDDDVIASNSTTKPGTFTDTDQDADGIPKRPKLDKNLTIWFEDFDGVSPTQENVKLNNAVPVMIDPHDTIVNIKSGSTIDCSTPHSSLKKPMAQSLKR